MTDGFVFYASFLEAIDALPEDEQLAAFKAVCNYAIKGEIPNATGSAKTVYILAKPQIDANQKRRQAGRRGGEANGSNAEANAKQTASKPQANAKQNEAKVKVKGKVKDKAKDKVKDKVKVNVKDIEAFEMTDQVVAGVESFIEHRANMKKPMTDNAVHLLVKKLYEMGQTDKDRIALLDEAVLHGWMSIYPFKESPPKMKPLKKNAFTRFDQREYDESDLESMLLEGVRR